MKVHLCNNLKKKFVFITAMILHGVRVGEHNIKTTKDCDYDNGVIEDCAEKHQDFLTEKVIFHPNYSNVTHHNDIALIRLSRDIDFKPPNAKPICLPIGGFSKITSKKVNLLDFFL